MYQSKTVIGNDFVRRNVEGIWAKISLIFYAQLLNSVNDIDEKTRI